MDAGKDEVDGSSNASQSPGRNNHSHRNTDEQIQRLERVFNEFPHPDEDMKMQLSRELGLSPRHIQSWFQNRRRQLKAQAKAEIAALYAENDRILRENNALKEAIEYKKFLSCRECINEQNLRLENAELKEQLREISSVIEKYTGRPFSFHLANQGIADGLKVPTGSIFGKSNNYVLDSNDSTGSR